MALSIDYMLQNGYTFVGIFTKPKYPSQSKVWMEIVTDGTRTDLVQFTLVTDFEYRKSFQCSHWYIFLYLTSDITYVMKIRYLTSLKQ